ncbi:MAG TPA: AMMECR1 domain-containing protein [bacterium]|nr:AMMECR1 domain-containing protein [Candidatus Omnitrophota bacterium]HOJ60109.1 AMMECR1 domain-containing protein [bacterium]HPP02039.1 AMMECR1 domain-containing protein [bacterium]
MNRLRLFSGLLFIMAAALPATGATAVVPAAPALSADETLKEYTDWAKSPEGPAFLAFIRQTVQAVASGEPLPASDCHFPWLKQPVGVFVTAMKGKQVRSCVGTFSPAGPTLRDEIIHQCRRLVTEDPRHPPLDPYELDDLRFVVTFAGAARHLENPADADIWREGLIARCHGREAVLLPGEAKTLSWGLAFLHRQIQKSKDETVVYAAFPVVVLSEPWKPILAAEDQTPTGDTKGRKNKKKAD